MTTAASASSERAAPSLVARLIATGFGSGYAPVAPGTAGSAVGLLLYWPLALLPFPAQAAAVVIVFFAGVAASSHLAQRLGIEDPGVVVIDEVVGMWVTLLLLPFTPVTAAVGFVAFRVMDVLKPFPARQLENLHGGWGIMADDLMAGIYANLLVRLALLVVPAA